jgi:hypothetical protein
MPSPSSFGGGKDLRKERDKVLEQITMTFNSKHGNANGDPT